MARKPLSVKKLVSQLDERLIKLDWGNLKDKNIYKILSIKGPLTCSELVNETGISYSTLVDVLNRLITQGLVVRFSERRKTKGRPKVFFDVNR